MLALLNLKLKSLCINCAKRLVYKKHILERRRCQLQAWLSVTRAYKRSLCATKLVHNNRNATWQQKNCCWLDNMAQTNMANTTVQVDVFWIGSNSPVASLELSYINANLCAAVRRFMNQLSMEANVTQRNIKLSAITSAGISSVDMNMLTLYNDQGVCSSTEACVLKEWSVLLQADTQLPPPTRIRLALTHRNSADLAVDYLWRTSTTEWYVDFVKSFRQMAPRLRNHFRVARVAVLIDYGCWKHVGSDLTSSKAFVMAMIASCNDPCLQWASKELRNAKDVVLAAVLKNGSDLQHASDSMRDDVDVVVAAVANDFRAYEWASWRLCCTKDVAVAMVGNYGQALELVPSELLDEKDVVVAAVGNDGWAINWASSRLQEDTDVILAAVKTRPSVVKYSGRQDQDDFWAAALRVNGKVFKYIPWFMQDSVLALVKLTSLQNKLDQSADKPVDCNECN